MEPIYRQTYPVRDCDVDCFGRLKASMALFFAQDIAGRHCDLLSVDHDTLAKRRLFWAVTRHRVQITRMPARGETVTVETWPMPTTRVTYPRSTVAYDEQGKELFRSISLWVLMEADSRSLVLPGESGVDVAGMLRGSELTAPGSLVPKALKRSRSRQVCFTDLDRNGHMNNCRYLDWMYDLLPAQFHSRHPVREFTICYLSEAREGDEMQLRWDTLPDGSLRIEAARDVPASTPGHGRVFSAQLLF